MATSGLLSLKWNNHRSTFFHILTTIRSKESYCDVTIACDGNFYPVHKFVLSTCSDYFEQMFAKTNCKHPVIVLKDIRSQELEALLNYMYMGEVNVLQNDLAGLIKAAECLMIKGLAVPDEAPSKENKRTYNPQEDNPSSKRRKRDEEVRLPPPHAAPQSQLPRRELTDSQVSSQSQQRQSSSASVPAPSMALPSLPPPNTISPSPSTGSASEFLSEECNQLGLADASEQPLQVKEEASLVKAQDSMSLTAEQISNQSEDSLPDIVLDEPGIKDEPQDIEEMTDTKIFESLPFEHSGEGEAVGDQQDAAGGEATSHVPTAFDSQRLAAPPPQSMEELVAQAIPGSSGMQVNSAWEGEGSFPMENVSGDASRPPQMAFPGGVMMASIAGDIKLRLRRHTCLYCNHTFRDRHDLQRHVRVHTGEKPYSCPHCPYRAATSSNIKKHIICRHKLIPGVNC